MSNDLEARYRDAINKIIDVLGAPAIEGYAGSNDDSLKLKVIRVLCREAMPSNALWLKSAKRKRKRKGKGPEMADIDAFLNESVSFLDQLDKIGD